MERKIETDTEKAQRFLLEKNEYFELTLRPVLDDKLVGVLLYYYQAKGQLERKIQKEKELFSESDIQNFNVNSTRLDDIKKDVFKSDLSVLNKKYNESLILSALVQLIRDNEANSILYDNYVNLKEKFYSWPKLGIKNDRILLAWKDFSNAIKEVEDWLLEKKNMYLPSVEKLIKLFEENDSATGEDFYDILHNMPDKQIFYIICNVLLTNPLLRREFLEISLLQGEKLVKFEKMIVNMLDILGEKTPDNTLKGLIFLFKKQLNESRTEILVL